jgi:hypothetical protein
VDKRKGSGGLQRIGELLPPLPEHIEPKEREVPAKALTVQKKHHYTLERQIDDLLEIGGDNRPEVGFMARMLTLCSLPRTDPGNQGQYKRVNGPYRLYMQAGPESKLPFGSLPRLLLAWICTEAVRTQSRDLELGQSLQAFMQELGIYSTSGGKRGDRTRLRNQIERLFRAQIHMFYQVPGHTNHTKEMSSPISDHREFWWDYNAPEQDTLWQSKVRLGEPFFNEIIAHPVPIDMRILKKMKRSSLGLDLYMWLTYKTFSLAAKGKGPQRLSWMALYQQFGSRNGVVDEHEAMRNFRKEAIRELKKLKLCWPAFSYSTPEGCLEIRPCMPSIKPKPKQLPN